MCEAQRQSAQRLRLLPLQRGRNQDKRRASVGRHDGKRAVPDGADYPASVGANQNGRAKDGRPKAPQGATSSDSTACLGSGAARGDQAAKPRGRGRRAVAMLTALPPPSRSPAKADNTSCSASPGPARSRPPSACAGATATARDTRRTNHQGVSRQLCRPMSAVASPLQRGSPDARRPRSRAGGARARAAPAAPTT